MWWKDTPCLNDLIVECSNRCLLCPTDAFKVRFVFVLKGHTVLSSYSSCARRTGRVRNKGGTVCPCSFVFRMLSALRGVAPV